MMRPAFLALVGAAAFWTPPAAAQNTLAFSESNGVEIVAQGSPWCRSTLQLQFRLSETSRLRDEAALIDFAPRIAPVLEAECSDAQAAEVRLTDERGDSLGDRPVYRMTAAEGWALAAQGSPAEAPSATSPVSSESDVENLSETPEPISSEEDLEALFASAEPIGNEGFLQAIFHFSPQYGDVSRFENTPLSLGGLFACELQQRANRNDEFAERQLRDEMEPVIANLRESGARILEREFRIRYETALGEYAFDNGAFPISPFDGQLNLGGFDEPRGCRARYNESIPYTFLLRFSEDSELDQLPMSREAAQSYLEDMRRRNFNQREVFADVVYRVTGFDANGGRGVLTVEPVALRLLHRTTQETLLALDRNALEEQRAAAEERRLEAERQAEIERRQAEARRLRDQRDREIEFMGNRLERTSSRAERIFIVHTPEDAASASFDHPSLIAARAERFDEGQFGVVMFQAGRTRDGITTARWPSPLRVDVRDRSIDLPLARGDWFLAYGEIEADPDATDRPGLIAALMEADWIFACESEGCEDEGDPDELIERFEERLDERIEAMLEGEESEE